MPPKQRAGSLIAPVLWEWKWRNRLPLVLRRKRRSVDSSVDIGGVPCVVLWWYQPISHEAGVLRPGNESSATGDCFYCFDEDKEQKKKIISRRKRRDGVIYLLCLQFAYLLSLILYFHHSAFQLVRKLRAFFFKCFQFSNFFVSLQYFLI
jgi:hypothetical protein